jgi:hypothetical protein
METRSLTFSGGLILGASLMYLLDPERGRGQCIAGALGFAAVAYGAGLLTQNRREHTSTAYDIDMPKYAWLR